MKRFLLSITVLATAVAVVSGCSSERRWNDHDRRELRKEIKAYRDMAYLNNLAEVEFDLFSNGVIEAIEVDYPFYTTFIELPSRGDTVEVYVVSMIVDQLQTNAHNMRNIYPYPWLVSQGILPSGLNHQAQRAFYECFARKVNNNFDSTEAFFNEVVNGTAPDALITDMQMQCAADLFDWGVEVDETIIIGD